LVEAVALTLATQTVLLEEVVAVRHILVVVLKALVQQVKDLLAVKILVLAMLKQAVVVVVLGQLEHQEIQIQDLLVVLA
jgi:hypothetical protein